MKCHSCGKEWQPKTAPKNPNRLPNLWHRDHDGNPHCGPCWHARYILRAITFRIVGPKDGDWPSLRDGLKKCWQTSTRLSNWAARECAKIDVVRTPSQQKLPKMPSIYLYGLAKDQGIDMGSDMQSTQAILRAAEAKYRAQRYDSIWLGKASLLRFRYPTPYPIHKDSWRLALQEERLVLSVRLDGERRELILAGGQGYRRQRRAAQKLIAGLAMCGEAAIYERTSHSSDHRNGTDRRDSGRQKAARMIMAKLVLWLPRDQMVQSEGTLFAHTGGNSLLTALNAKDECLWTYNGDHIRRWAAEHQRRLTRWNEDAKAENRPPRFGSRREASVRKSRARLDSATHELSAQLVGYARRRRFASLQYDDTDQSYVDKFPYFILRERIAQKCDESGIKFEYSGDAKRAASTRNNVSKEHD